MELRGKPRHGREGRRLSEREVSESNPGKLPESAATGFLDSAGNDFYGISLLLLWHEPFRAQAD